MEEIQIRKLKKENEPLCKIGYSFACDGNDEWKHINNLCNLKQIYKCSYYAIINNNLPNLQVIGIVIAEEREDYVDIRLLYVLEEFRNKGIGTMLVNKIVEYSRKKNKPMQLYCNKTLKNFYERLGFETSENLIVMLNQKGEKNNG